MRLTSLSFRSTWFTFSEPSARLELINKNASNDLFFLKPILLHQRNISNQVLFITQTSILFILFHRDRQKLDTKNVAMYPVAKTGKFESIRKKHRC